MYSYWNVLILTCCATATSVGAPKIPSFERNSRSKFEFQKTGAGDFRATKDTHKLGKSLKLERHNGP
jgi:hypothetical protein